MKFLTCPLRFPTSGDMSGMKLTYINVEDSNVVINKKMLMANYPSVMSVSESEVQFNGADQSFDQLKTLDWNGLCCNAAV